ncbi:MAG: hypothetical protein GVY36_17155 [Verrucomicrobia bacterium]|jgi:biopolymer transport protein ExbB/TolQ|nr:hypothetical protein [Verrucomicrobiota bacterium]
MDILDLKKLDIEARVGFRPGRYTNANRSLAFLAAMLMTIGFYGILINLPSSLQSERYIGIFTDRGVIPYITMLAFFWGICLVWLKARKANAQASALRFLLREKVNEWQFSVSDAAKLRDKLTKLVPAPVDFILPNRLYLTLTSLSTLRQPMAISGLVAEQANSDEAQVDDSYSFLTMLLYIIPVLGFIGTVLGLGAAIGNFGTTLSQVGGADLDAMLPSLQGVTGGLALAFDTTLLALVAALLLQIYASFVRSTETSFLEDCNLFFQQEVFPKLTAEIEETPTTSTTQA